MTADDYAVPADAPRHDCGHCDAAFASERHLALHRGLEHDDLTEAERAAFGAAREAEEEELRRYRILMLGALVVVYFALLFAYALVT
ncbi:MAG: C2H2-type zinc finger protein [Haloferacaceae archaeon]